MELWFLSGMLVHAGDWLWRRSRRSLQIVACEILVKFESSLGISLCLREIAFRIIRFALGEHLEPILGKQIILHLAFRRSRIDLERVFTPFRPARIKSIHEPLP